MGPGTPVKDWYSSFLSFKDILDYHKFIVLI